MLTMLNHHNCNNIKKTKQRDKHTHTHTRLTALYPALPGWAGTRKVKPIWILLKQETMSGSGISWSMCKSAPCSRQITTPAPHRSVFTGRMPFLPPNQQWQSTEGKTDRQTERWKGTRLTLYAFCYGSSRCNKKMIPSNAVRCLFYGFCPQCFDAVGSAAGRASGL